jgi:hypothetical protein
MGAAESKGSETINWKNIKTNDMSSSVSNVHGISKDAKTLIMQLNLPEVSLDSSSNNDLLEFKNKNVNKLNNYNKNNIESEVFHSPSSPFISSEMYDYIVNKYKNPKALTNMVGGGKKKFINKVNSNLSPDDTSDTTSDSSDEKKVTKSKVVVNTESDLDSNSESGSESASTPVPEKPKLTHKSILSKKSVKKNKKPKKVSGNSDIDLSYNSSSAHTGGAYGDNSTQNDSISNENNVMYSSSINTSDINMISE